MLSIKYLIEILQISFPRISRSPLRIPTLIFTESQQIFSQSSELLRRNGLKYLKGDNRYSPIIFEFIFLEDVQIYPEDLYILP